MSELEREVIPGVYNLLESRAYFSYSSVANNTVDVGT